MTELIYQTDSYCQTFDARVVAVDEANRAVLLDRTAFYPGGGGQPYDLGVLNFIGGDDPPRGRRSGEALPPRASSTRWGKGGDEALPPRASSTRRGKGSDEALPPCGGDEALERARKGPEGVPPGGGAEAVWHVLQPGAVLPVVGTAVQGRLDWPRRYRLMRTHTAMHILCGVVFRDFGALVTGGDMEPLQGRMDFEFESLSKELVGVIEAAVNREVAAARAVRVQILPREAAFAIPDLIRTKINLLPAGISEVRTIELVGLDLQADGGTHVRSTAEVGRMRVVDYKSKGKINKRIYVELDETLAPQ